MKILIESWISGIDLQNHLKLLKYKLGIITNSNHNKREFYEKYFQSVCLFNRIFSSALLAQDLKIAAAANLTRALKALVKEFQKEHSKDAISISALILQANSTLKSFKTPLLIYSFQQILLGLKSFMMKK
ncbi:hypothetical protein HpMS30_03220 [Helicobacter pylori]